MATLIKELKPKHYILIQKLLENPGMSRDEMAEILNVKKDNVWATFNAPVFIEALNKACKERFKDAQRYAVQTMEKLAKEGDFQASKFILENTGYKEETNIKINMEDIEINIINNDED